MSHSKGTTNYNLPLFTKDDRPAWLTDFNSAMLEVDNVVKGLSDKVKGGGLPTSGGTMDGNINMNEHALMNVQEVELPSSGSGLYVGAVVQPTGTTGARLTGVGNANAAAFVEPDTQDNYVPVRVGTPQTGDDAVNKNSLNGTLSSYMKKSGATMTGALILGGAPTEDLQAATKKYVDDNAGGGGVSQEYVDALVATRLPINGGTMTGDLVLVSDVPATEHSATSKNYVLGAFGSCLPKSGGTMTGTLTLSGAPTGDLQAATKKYVDDNANRDVWSLVYKANVAATGVTVTEQGTVTINSMLTATKLKLVVSPLDASKPITVKGIDYYAATTGGPIDSFTPITGMPSELVFEYPIIGVNSINNFVTVHFPILSSNVAAGQNVSAACALFKLSVADGAFTNAVTGDNAKIEIYLNRR